MKYVDTSVFVSALIPEQQSERAIAWLSYQPRQSLAISAWVSVEFSAALARKLRTGRLSKPDRDLALSEYREVLLASLTLPPIEHSHYAAAALISDQHEFGIRAGDALHLSLATFHSMPLATLDKAFAAGATRLGYSVELIA